MASESLAVEIWDKAFCRRRPFLPEAVLNTDFLCKIQNFFIFFCCQSPQQGAAGKFGILRQMFHGGILVHNTDIYVISISVMEIPQYSFGIPGLTRKN